MEVTEHETPDLADVMGMLARLHTVAPMGRDGRRILLALSAVDPEKLDGLVIDGETYDITYRTQWAVCRCGDKKHEARRDAPPGRAAWQTTRREADASLATAIDRWQWAGGRTPKPHRVFHIVATTSTEAVS